MDALKKYVISLTKIKKGDEKLVGGKAYQLSRLLRAGYKTPNGFVITIHFYQDFVKHNQLQEKIAFELGRKDFENMRWEEIWDAALRIRSAFLAGQYSGDLKQKILTQLKPLDITKQLAARSSSPKEDTVSASFAGLHESIIGIKDETGLLKSIKQVWASLWSDAALLYQHELGLDPMKSTMAVVVQELVQEPVSGVAFGIDPRNPASNQSIIEAIPGLCENLVDGSIDPDRWILNKKTGALITHKKGVRNSDQELLDVKDVQQIFKMLTNLSDIFGWNADTEWTGRKEKFTLLQARPITTASDNKDDKKAYYLTLRPGEKRLKVLAQKVAGELIPQLENLGHEMAMEPIEQLDNAALAEKILEWHRLLNHWKDIYKAYFIPFAHGVRHLASYYNDVVQPYDPYEFVGLLKGQKMIAGERNKKMMQLAKYLVHHEKLRVNLQSSVNAKNWNDMKLILNETRPGREFLQIFDDLLTTYMDISYQQDRLNHEPLIILKNVLEIAKKTPIRKKKSVNSIAALEDKFFSKIAPEKIEEAKKTLKIGRLSWRLRDDDNLLIGKVESQLLKALDSAVLRLKQTGQLNPDAIIGIEHAEIIAASLTTSKKIQLPKEKTDQPSGLKFSGKARQIVGQPAAAGLTSGLARVIQTTGDLGRFKAGEVLVCDAIQPNMTHLVPLASAIIERRGGMLIHGAIIAREMGIPCVNGVPNAAELIRTGDLVTVDGHLGVVTIGAAEFNLELKPNG